MTATSACPLRMGAIHSNLTSPTGDPGRCLDSCPPQSYRGCRPESLGTNRSKLTHVSTGDIMRLVRWDPFRDLMNIQRQASEVEREYGTWAPVVDIFDMGDDLVIRAEVPGLEKDDVEISVE